MPGRWEAEGTMSSYEVPLPDRKSESSNEVPMPESRNRGRRRARAEAPFQRPPRVGPDGRVIRPRRTFRSVLKDLQPLAMLVVVALVTAGFVVRTNRVAYVAGNASDITPRMSISGGQDNPPTGRILLATVGITGKLTYFQAIRGWLDPDTDVFDFEEVFPTGRTSELKRAQVMMDDSKVVATLAALRALGRDGVGSGVKVIEVLEKSPSKGRLEVGDVIKRINGTDICIGSDLRVGIKSTEGLEPVNLEVVRKSSGATELVQMVPLEEQGFRYIGVGVETVKCVLPVNVTIDTANIGGPSAGLSMTLAILDRLTAGELTGGQVIAATGTIDGDGSVGDVGGVKQKTAGVIAAGAKLFLVPPGEEREARARAGKLPVVAVRNLDEALAALRRYGGQPLPSPRATP